MFSPVTARGLATATGLLDVTKEIKIDHDNVRELFQRYKSAQTLDEKKVLANTLIREMSIHGDAEEISVYNDYDKIGLTNAVQHNKEEHADVKKLIFKAEHAFTSSEKYDQVMSEAVDAFLKHAEEEERDQLETLRKKLSPEDNDAIARAFLKARETVPFRPHPLTPQTGGAVQKGMGMHGKVQDKIIEKVTGREYVDLKYSHSQP
ncbi:hypothetical protein K474DRAFT_1667469 [Panus rudis PR-1116 ss-1]|nr:hypothetical protein K474DRAFT_1667469 [Panus rudis PR-1116 ss-1]